MQLQDQLALLVGGAQDIGRATAEALAVAGADVVIADIDSNAAERAASPVRSTGRRVTAQRLDVTDEAAVQACVAAVAAAHEGRLDLVVNLAAVIDKAAPIWEMPKQTWDSSLAVDLTGTFLVCREALKVMIPNRRGKIVNISSIAGKMAYALRASYAVAKAGVNRLTECIALEAAPFGIQVNAICPGPIQGSRMRAIIANRARAMGKEVSQIEAEYHENIPLGKFVPPSDIADMIVHLASPAGDRITGQCLDIDGGYLLK